MTQWDRDLMCVERLHFMMVQLQSMPSCLAGGPIHVVVDDGNLTDEDLREAVDSLPTALNDDIFALCLHILQDLQYLSYGQRVLWFTWEYGDHEIADARGKPYALDPNDSTKAILQQ